MSQSEISIFFHTHIKKIFCSFLICLSSIFLISCSDSDDSNKNNGTKKAEKHLRIVSIYAPATFDPHIEPNWFDMAMFGIEGLSLSAAYIKGTGIDGTKMSRNSAYAWLGYGKNGKHWERDLTAKYTISSGFAKDLTILIRHDVHRGNKAQAELDTNQIRLAMEYPLSW